MELYAQSLDLSPATNVARSSQAKTNSNIAACLLKLGGSLNPSHDYIIMVAPDLGKYHDAAPYAERAVALDPLFAKATLTPINYPQTTNVHYSRTYIAGDTYVLSLVVLLESLSTIYFQPAQAYHGPSAYLHNTKATLVAAGLVATRYY